MSELLTEDMLNEDVPEIPDYLEKVMLMALDEGKAKIIAGELLVPFTALAIKDNLFIESHPGDDADECFAAAKRCVENARGAGAYAFCYDGFVETDDGDLDCIIAEGGIPGEEDGFAIGYIYEMDEDGGVSIEDEPVFVGDAPNFMEALKAADEYAEDEIEGRYADGEGFDAE